MLKSSEGIVLRTLKYGETSIILDIFSPHSGIQSYIIGGVRKKKARTKASVTAVLNLVRFVYYDKHTSAIQRIKEIQFEHIYRTLPFDIIKSSQALFLAEILKKSLKGSDSNPTIYAFIKERFIAFDLLDRPPVNFHLGFMLDLSSLLGFEIRNNYSGQSRYFNMEDGSFTSFSGGLRYLLSEESSLHLSVLLKGEDPDMGRMQRLALLQHLVDFYRFHIEGFGQVKSLEVLKSLYS